MKGIRRTVTALVIIGILWGIYVQWLIHYAEKTYSSDTRDAGIVLGAALWDDRPSPALRERLDLAVKLYQDRYFSRVIVTGGLDENGSTIPEARGMAAYLMRQGIPESDIFIEPVARSTYENLKYTRDIMDNNGWSSAYIITHTYHGARALDIAEYLGYDSPAVALTDSKVMWMPWHKMRETLAFTKWKLMKWFVLESESGG